jgi:alkane 1-monooxygenase
MLVKDIGFLKQLYKDCKEDNLLFYSFQYYFVIMIYIFLLICCRLKNPFILIWFLYGIVPLIDQIIKLDLKNPTKEEQKKLSREIRFKIPLYITVVFDWVFLIWGIKEIFTNTNGYFYSIGIFIVIGTLQSSSINISHEIFHKAKTWDKIIGTLNLSKNLYMHFLIEHLEGHHKNVSTPEDPATSKLNQSVYHFLPRTIIGGYLSAWTIENRNCLEVHKTVFTPYNRMFYFSASNVLIPLIVFFYFGWKVTIVFALLALMSVIYLEVINYFEHYGLSRKKLENGVYENVNISHSWNAPHRLSNYILFKLQRHSDHHENSLKPYQSLCSYEESPTLPNGYSMCLLLALFPQLWFSIMNPLVEVYKNGQKPTEKMKEEIHDRILKIIYNLNIVACVFIMIQYFVVII